MAEFTPGPWITGRFVDRVTTEVDTDGSLSICHVYESGGRQEANARFIAASPTMFKELTMIRDELLDAIDGGEECRGRDAWLSELILRCDNGIAKALGK